MNCKILFAATLLTFCLPHLDSAGAAETASCPGYNAPTGIAIDKAGAVYVSEWSAGRVARLENGKKTIVLENLPSPAGMVFDDESNLYIAGYGDGSIYVWDGKKPPRVLATGFSAPAGLLWTREGNLLVANRNAGEVVELAQDGSKRVLSSGHKTPVGLARTEDGHLFVSCYGGSVDVIDPSGKKSSISARLDTPGVGIVPDGNGGAYVVDYARGNIAQLGCGGVRDIVAGGLASPVALAVMPNGNLLVGCWGDNSLHVIDVQGAK